MSFDIEICARTVWMEFRGEGSDAMLAGAWSIINRHNSGRWYAGKTLAQCCLYSALVGGKYSNFGQYSSWNTDDPNRMSMACVADDDPLLTECLSYVMDALQGDGSDPTGGATHYYANTLPAPPAWAATGTFTVQVGKTRFYKNVN